MTRLDDIRARHLAAVRHSDVAHTVDSRDDDIGYLLNELAWMHEAAENWRWVSGKWPWLEEYVLRERAKIIDAPT